ncbi:hypothetical protein M1L65_07060 [Slackia exigua]|uniref:hypothetical protein n=1 Tax=Slackia exigua TaxID=84109 RepID=UPI003BA110A9
MSAGVFWAWRAFLWAKAPWPAEPGSTRFDEALRRIRSEAGRPGRVTVMRNQASMGMNNNYWPAVSRWAVMADPALAKKVHPRYVADLDDAPGTAQMRAWYRQLTGERPKAGSWKEDAASAQVFDAPGLDHRRGSLPRGERGACSPPRDMQAPEEVGEVCEA